MELTYTDIIYLVFALNKVLQTDMSQIDKAQYESLLYRMKISEKGKRIRKEFLDGEKPCADPKLLKDCTDTWKRMVEGK